MRRIRPFEGCGNAGRRLRNRLRQYCQRYHHPHGARRQLPHGISGGFCGFCAFARNSSVILIGTQDRHKCFLRDVDFADQLHAFCTLFLFSFTLSVTILIQPRSSHPCIYPPVAPKSIPIPAVPQEKTGIPIAPRSK